jgi:hypothetical protein
MLALNVAGAVGGLESEQAASPAAEAAKRRNVGEIRLRQYIVDLLA